MNNEFNNQNMNQFQNSNMNNEYSNNYNNLNNNKSNNNGLIVMLVIIIIVLSGLCVFFALDKKDNNVDNNNNNNQEQENNNQQDNNNNQNNEYDEQKHANDFFNSFKKKGNIKFNFVDDVGTLINDSSVINELKENVEIIETIEEGLGSDKYIYEIDNVKNISEDDKVRRIVFYYAGNNITPEEIIEDAVSAEKVKQKFYELYGSNITFTNAIDETNENLVFTDKGSNYQSAGYTCSYREKTNMFVCRPTHGGVGPWASRILTHIYNYKKEGEYYYVYISVARWISYSGSEVDRQVISSEVNDLKIYKDSDKDGELYNFKIDETNYNNFDKYRYTFKLNSDGETFRFVGLDKVK